VVPSKRVHVPAIARTGGRAFPALFGDNGMRGEMITQAADEERFGAAIGFRDDINFTFVGDVFGAVEFGEEEGASFAAASAAISRTGSSSVARAR